MHNFNGMNGNWVRNKAVRVLTHVAVWVIALSLPYVLDSHHGMHHHFESDERAQSFFYLNLFTNFLYVGPFYLNAYWLTPKLFNRRRYLAFSGSLLLMLGVVLLLHFVMFTYIFRLEHFSPLGAMGFLFPPFALAIAISTTFRVVSDNLTAERLAHDRQEENLKTELSFLRSQINPHFIFNILNNLVALEQMKSPELGPTIFKLSALMQYMLYEADEESVSLQREQDYLESYIDLQRQRFGEKVPVSVSMHVPDGFYEIEPMLLIPFVENAFKHGVGMIEDPSIGIELQVKDHTLHFSVRNRYNPLSEEIKDKGSGIGLGNVSRRLKLLYGDQHVLQISREDGWFIVTLELKLH